MEQTLKIVSWVEIVLGALALLGWASDTSDGFAFLGAVLFLTAGIVALCYINEKK